MVSFNFSLTANSMPATLEEAMNTYSRTDVFRDWVL